VLFVFFVVHAFAYTSAMALKSSRRSELRAQAHKLSPVVIVGDKGLTDEVIAEIDRSLKAHELIKVRASSAERDARGTWMETICGKLGAEAVQQIGKVLVIYRQNEDEEKQAKKPARAVKREPAGSKTAPPRGISRPRSRTPSARPESEPRRRRPRSSR
jgi:RNA-binding protein